MNKPVINYINKMSLYIQEGSTAHIEAVDPAASATPQFICTSIVESFDPMTGIFETSNAVYKPIQQLNG